MVDTGMDGPVAGQVDRSRATIRAGEDDLLGESPRCRSWNAGTAAVSAQGESATPTAEVKLSVRIKFP